jgi:thioredoxin reductase (NADPH)
MDKIYDLAIIGAGPAGMTAAIYAKRAGLAVIMFEGSAPCGKLVKTFEIDNWPGESHISGVDLAMKMYQHTSDLEIETEFVGVKTIRDGVHKVLDLEDGRTFTAKAVILATGTIENKMNVPNEDRLTGHGVSFCAVCDGAFYRNRHVVVIGGGNSALEEAVYLTQFANKVTIVIRRDVFRADKSAQDHALTHPKIEVIRHTVPVAVIGETKVTAIRLRDLETKEEYDVATDGIFPYIGAAANTSAVAHLNVLDEGGYMIVNEKMESKIPGLYGAGDVCVKPLRQIVTAVSDGATSAQMAFHYIQSLKES